MASKGTTRCASDDAARLKRGEQINWTLTDPEVKAVLLKWFGGSKNFGWQYGKFTKAKLRDVNQKMNVL